jgi:nucleoside 2-deoxyribosyltransferase
MGKKINIYLSARVSKDAHDWNNKVAAVLKAPIQVSKPHEYTPVDLEHKDFPRKIFKTCVREMQRSHFALLLPPYGRDCAWEIGWYYNSPKPVILFADEQTEWLRDWMVKGGIDYIVTNNKKTYGLLCKDPILRKNNIFLIKEISEMNSVIIKLFDKHYN